MPTHLPCKSITCSTKKLQTKVESAKSGYGPDLDFEDLQRAFGEQIQKLDEVVSKESHPDKGGEFLLSGSPQPEMLHAVAILLIEQWKTLAVGDPDLRTENRSLILLALKVAIEVLDRRCREE